MHAPTAITVKQKARVVEVTWQDGTQDTLPFELAKETVGITRVEPVGVYAVRLHFDDGHNTGLYSWTYLRELGEQYDSKWARYLERCEKLGYERKPPA